jgi:hypothetical protein
MHVPKHLFVRREAPVGASCDAEGCDGRARRVTIKPILDFG